MLLTEKFKEEMTRSCRASAEKYEKRLHITIPEDVIDNNIAELRLVLEKIRVGEKDNGPLRYKYEPPQDEEEIAQNLADMMDGGARTSLSKRKTDRLDLLMDAFYYTNVEEAQYCVFTTFTGDGILYRRISGMTARLCRVVEMGAPNVIVQNEIRMLFEATLLLTLVAAGDISLSEAECAYRGEQGALGAKPVNHARDRVKELEQMLTENDTQKYEKIIAGLNSQVAALKKTIDSERAQSMAKIAKLDKENRQLDHQIDELTKTIDRMATARK